MVNTKLDIHICGPLGPVFHFDPYPSISSSQPPATHPATLRFSTRWTEPPGLLPPRGWSLGQRGDPGATPRRWERQPKPGGLGPDDGPKIGHVSMGRKGWRMGKIRRNSENFPMGVGRFWPVFGRFLLGSMVFYFLIFLCVPSSQQLNLAGSQGMTLPGAWCNVKWPGDQYMRKIHQSYDVMKLYEIIWTNI